MAPLWALIKKEFLLLRRDWHALLLLFVMPAFFILIMSLALRDTFAGHGNVSLSYELYSLDNNVVIGSIASELQRNSNFHSLDLDGTQETFQEKVSQDQFQFLIVIPPGFGAAMLKSKPLPLELYTAPSVQPSNAKLFEASLREAIARVYITQSLGALKKNLGSFFVTDKVFPTPDLGAIDRMVISSPAGQDGTVGQLPSSVQQNVPAWLIFAMFFIAIPLSTTWIQERSQGTYLRLKAMGTKKHMLLLGKLLPYLLVNLLQVILMFAVGMFIVPRLGGDALTLGHSPAGLALMALSLSFASVSYALLIANLVSTNEQATIFTGVSNLLLAALGGIMVPRFVMPLIMQKISLASPMAWGLEGFLDVLLRQGGLPQVFPWAGLLFAFGLASLALASLSLERFRGH